MNLIVDAGNSFLKLAVFEKNTLLKIHKTDYAEVMLLLEKVLGENKITHSILASTTHLNPDVLAFLSAHTKCLMLSHQTNLPFKNAYETPETLGLDRLALACSAVKQFPDQNTLIVDAGTCVTYDFVDKYGVYQGGAISPGLSMRFKAMHNFTGKLPLISADDYEASQIGQSTKASMQIGVVEGMANEIDGFIQSYQVDYEDLTVILTGGDHQLLSTRLKNSIFATSNFLIEGLNFILEYNKNT
ncbi:type III pantothenate kinase [Psychroflexus halocasei]|uniref:Type III pantothenate kinase n=1 Tax=Psychroflexus halocasei TaxID=908615 RepID=A0A1H3W440_9FLAO|nr:type III pantothenate kinase [Psychroflexus halocasei]SDZ81611.1 type III pantothenate kinase [Psychroflexus halocasei]